jgi:hypothetical protein
MATATALSGPWPDSFSHLTGIIIVIAQFRWWDLQHGSVRVVIIVHNIRCGSHPRPQILVSAVAMYHTSLTNHSPVAPGSWKNPGPPPLNPLHLDLEAPGAAHGYTSMATMPVNLVGGYGDERAL